MNNYNRRNIDTSQIFGETYKVQQRREINESNNLEKSNFQKKILGINNMNELKKNFIKENSVSNKVNRLNQRINSNQEMNRANNLNNFLGKFK